jgi:glycosyltransferase involved in cell wall biosynthesis
VARARGGVEASFANLLTGLATLNGVEPHVLTFAGDLEQPHRAAVNGVPVTYLPGTRRFGNLTLHARERRLLAHALDELRPDVVHAQEAQRYGYVCLRTERHAPVVVSIHGIVLEDLAYAAGVRARMRVRLAGIPLERYCVRHARFLVAPTRYAEQVFGHDIRGRLWDVPNAVAEPFFSVEPAPEQGRILYAGGVTRGKRLLDLLEAMPDIAELAPSAHVHIAGDFLDATYARDVQERVADLGLGSRVSFLGGLGPDGLLDEYRQASVLVLPSGKETSPMVIGEAMAAAVPVVATRVGGIPSLVDDSATGYLVDVGDVAAIADRTAAVLADAGRHASLALTARARAAARFRPVEVAKRMASVYDEVVATT